MKEPRRLEAPGRGGEGSGVQGEVEGDHEPGAQDRHVTDVQLAGRVGLEKALSELVPTLRDPPVELDDSYWHDPPVLVSSGGAGLCLPCIYQHTGPLWIVSVHGPGERPWGCTSPRALRPRHPLPSTT